MTSATTNPAGDRRRSRRLETGVLAAGHERSGALLEDVAATMHAHPTLDEAVQEAALRALGQAQHG